MERIVERDSETDCGNVIVERTVERDSETDCGT